jgi:nucleoporin SEH1
MVQRWVERAVLVDARASVRGVEFAPHKFGMKLVRAFRTVPVVNCIDPLLQASISADNTLRIYECLEQPALTAWQLADEIDIPSLRSSSSGASNPDVHVPAAGTLTPLMADAPFVGGSGSLGHSPAPSVGPVLSSEPGSMGASRPGGAKEADGGWALSWCKDHLWGEILALSAGTDGIVKVCIYLSVIRRNLMSE